MPRDRRTRMFLAAEDKRVLASGVTIEDVRRQYAQTAGRTMWITEIQLDPPQLIVCDEANEKVYRVPFTTGGSTGTITFGDPVEVTVEYADVAAKAAPAVNGGIMPRERKISEEARRAILGALDRRAISRNRIDHYAGLVVDAENEADRADVVAMINTLWGPGGPAPGQGDDYDDDQFASLFPPKTGAEAERRAEIAASAARAWSDDELYDHLFPGGQS